MSKNPGTAQIGARSRHKRLTGEVALVFHVENKKRYTKKFRKSHVAGKIKGGPFRTCRNYLYSETVKN